MRSTEIEALRNRSEFNRKLTGERITKLLSKAVAGAFTIGFINFLLLRVINNLLGLNIFAHIIACLLLGLLFGWTLALIVIKLSKSVENILRPMFFNEQVLIDKIETAEERANGKESFKEDYDLVGENSGKKSNS